MAERPDTLARVIDALKRPVRMDPRVDERVMAAVDALPPYSARRAAGGAVLAWLRRPRTIRVSPLGALAAAAVLAGIVVAGTRVTSLLHEPEPFAGGPAASLQLVQFVFVAPEAASVALAGDFNDWDASATPLARQQGDGVWWVSVPLSPGRYRYSFVVDGGIWRGDPLAPRAEDEFGRPNSVVTIGGS